MGIDELSGMEKNYRTILYRWSYIRKALVQALKADLFKHSSIDVEDDYEIRFSFCSVASYARLVHDFSEGSIEYGILRADHPILVRKAVTSVPLDQFWETDEHLDILINKMKSRHYKILSKHLVHMAAEFFSTSYVDPETTSNAPVNRP